MQKFYIDEIDDETEEYRYGDVLVGDGRHDDDGWAGMEAKRTLLENIAKAIGTTVERR